MRPLTIYIDDIVNSRHHQHRTWGLGSGVVVLDKKYADVDTILDNIDEFALEYKNATGMEAKQWIEFLSEDPVMPPLLLDCDGKNVLSINLNKSMTNRTQTVRVNDRAKCMLIIKKTTSITTSSISLERKPIW